MAYIGLTRPVIAKRTEANGTATYSKGFVCGKAIGVEISPQYSEGSLYGDDVLAEYDKEFKYADITLNTTTIPKQAHEVMFGHTYTEAATGETPAPETITDKTSDEAGEVGFGVCVAEKVDGERKFVAMWMPKAKFTEGNESYSTKGDNIEYKTPSITGRASGDTDKMWRSRTIHATEEEAYAWLKKQANITAQ